MIDVLAFGAHPDDVELAIGGTMLRLRDAGLALGVVDFTRGERGSRGTPETRAAEAAKATEIMGLAFRETLDFPDTELQPTLELRRAAVEAIRRHRPKIILAPLSHDLHPDHAAAGQAVHDAFYPSGMRNADAAGEAYRPLRLLQFAMHHEEGNGVVVDVTSVWQERLELAQCFASQLHAPPPGTEGADFPTLIARGDFLSRIAARAQVWGRRAGVVFGEPLYPLGALPITDPLALLVEPLS